MYELSSNEYSTNESFKARRGDPASYRKKVNLRNRSIMLFVFLSFTQSYGRFRKRASNVNSHPYIIQLLRCAREKEHR